MRENSGPSTEAIIDPGCCSGVPIEAVVAARDSMADEYISKKLKLEKPTLITIWHRKRIEEKIRKIGRYLVQLDAWIKEMKR